VSDKDERPGRPGALPASATDEDSPAEAHPFFGAGPKMDGADTSVARTATKEPGNSGSKEPADADRTTVVRPVGSSSAAAKPGTPKSAAAKPGAGSGGAKPAEPKPELADQAGSATMKVATPVAGPPAAAGGDRSERYAAAGRGAPVGAAVAGKPAQAPRDPDTMAIVRTPGRASGDSGREPSAAREATSGRAAAERPERPAADRPAEQTRKVATVGAVPDPERTAVQRPDLAKPQRPPGVPAERMPAPGARPAGGPMGGPGPNQGPAPRPGGQDWARPGGAGRYDRPEPRPAAEHAADYAEDAGGRAGRRARLRLTRIDPLTVTKVSFAFSLCLFLVTIVAIAVLWFVLNSIGVYSSITDAAGTLTSNESHSVSSWLSFGRVMQISLLIGAINVVLLTVLSTLGALLYNLCADMIGGIEVTLSDG
jgi:hypothetical protein